jgi:hypothetical protein
MNDSQWRSIGPIFAEAAKSPMGVFALMVLGVLLLSYAFFRASLLKYRLTAFILIFLGAIGFAGTVLKEWLRTQTAAASSTASQVPARPAAASDAPAKPDRPPSKANAPSARPGPASAKSGLPDEQKLPDVVALARTFTDNGQFAEACRSYLEAVKTMGLENTSLARRATGLYNQDKYVDAVAVFEDALNEHARGEAK